MNEQRSTVRVNAIGARAVDPQVIRDAQLAAKRNRARQFWGELNHVRAGGLVGGQDRRPQRIVAGIVEVQHMEGAQERAVFEGLETRREASPGGDATGVSSAKVPAAVGAETTLHGLKPKSKRHGLSPREVACHPICGRVHGRCAFRASRLGLPPGSLAGLISLPQGTCRPGGMPGRGRTRLAPWASPAALFVGCMRRTKTGPAIPFGRALGRGLQAGLRRPPRGLTRQTARWSA